MTNYHAASVAKAVGDHYGLPADRWPASSEHVAPFFAIIVSALGLAEAGEFVEATCRAHRREKEHADKGGHKFAFAVHMSNERGNSKGNFFRTSGREARKGIQAIVRQDSTADLDDLLICAIAALRHCGAPARAVDQRESQKRQIGTIGAHSSRASAEGPSWGFGLAGLTVPGTHGALSSSRRRSARAPPSAGERTHQTPSRTRPMRPVEPLAEVPRPG